MTKKKKSFDILKEAMLDQASDWQQSVVENLTSECEKFLANHAIEAQKQNDLDDFRKWLWSEKAMKEIFNSKQNGVIWQSLSAAVLNIREAIEYDFAGDSEDNEALLEWARHSLGS